MPLSAPQHFSPWGGKTHTLRTPRRGSLISRSCEPAQFHSRVNKTITRLSAGHLSSNLTHLILTTVLKSRFYDPLFTPREPEEKAVQEKGHRYGGLGSRWQVSLSAPARVPNGGAAGGFGRPRETCPLPRCYNQVVKRFGGQLAPGQGIALSR